MSFIQVTVHLGDRPFSFLNFLYHVLNFMSIEHKNLNQKTTSMANSNLFNMVKYRFYLSPYLIIDKGTFRGIPDTTVSLNWGPDHLDELKLTRNV